MFQVFRVCVKRAGAGNRNLAHAKQEQLWQFHAGGALLNLEPNFGASFSPVRTKHLYPANIASLHFSFST